MGPLGFEPRASRLSAVRSNHAEPRAPFDLYEQIVSLMPFYNLKPIKGYIQALVFIIYKLYA